MNRETNLSRRDMLRCAGGTAVVAGTTGLAGCLGLLEGEPPEWTFETGGDLVDAGPAVVDGTAYIGAGQSDVDKMFAVNTTDGSLDWERGVDGWTTGSPVVTDGILYFGTADEKFYAVDTDDGSLRWSLDWGGPNPAVAADMLYVSDGGIAAIDRETRETVWSFSAAPGHQDSVPTVVGGRVYVGGDESVYAINAETGHERWSFETEGSVVSSATVDTETVYIGSNDGKLYAIDAGDGSKRWEYDLGARMYSASPTVNDGVVYLGSAANTLVALDAQTGAVQWEFDADASVLSSPTVAEDVVFVGSHNRYVHGLDVTDGSEVWKGDARSWVQTAPIVVDGLLYAGCRDGILYGFDAPVDGSSTGSRTTQGTLGHHEEWLHAES